MLLFSSCCYTDLCLWLVAGRDASALTLVFVVAVVALLLVAVAVFGTAVFEADASAVETADLPVSAEVRELSEFCVFVPVLVDLCAFAVSLSLPLVANAAEL